MIEDEDGRGGQVRDFLTMLRLQPTDADCERCRAQLDAYTRLQLNEEDYRGRLSWVAQHLDSCVQCAEAYAHVYELKWAEQTGHLSQPAIIPEPDLSFLAPATNFWTTLQTALQINQEKISLQLNAALLALLAPPL